MLFSSIGWYFEEIGLREFEFAEGHGDDPLVTLFDDRWLDRFCDHDLKSWKDLGTPGTQKTTNRHVSSARHQSARGEMA